MRIKTNILPTFAAFCVATLSFSIARAAEDAEENVKLNNIPAKAAKAIEKHAEGAKITNVSKEKDEGKVVYEATLNANGKIREVTVDGDGNLESVEEVVALSEVPEAARKVIEAESAGGKVEKTERITKGKTVTFEALISAKGKREEIVVSTAGKVVEREDKTHSKEKE